MALFQVVYVSSLVTDKPEILSSIIDSSLRNNERSNITGMMLYSNGNVLQVLEGERADVLQTFRAIQLDVRHYDIFVLIEEELASRNFGSWSMGFRELTTDDLKKLPVADAVFKVRPGEIALRVQPSEARIILKSFTSGTMGIS